MTADERRRIELIRDRVAGARIIEPPGLHALLEVVWDELDDLLKQDSASSRDSFGYDGPMQIVMGDGWWDVELGNNLTATPLGDELHGVFEGAVDNPWPPDVKLHRVRLSVEVVERDPPPPPPDQVLDFQGAPVPETPTNSIHERR